jgi:molybdopterin-guanine dinucleotide biosynthesis protein A
MVKKQQRLSAIILAGGKSKRMNGNKALLPISGECTLIEKLAGEIAPYFKEILVIAQSHESFDFLPYRIIVDEEPNIGPLMGILTGLRASNSEVNFVVACDIPEVNITFLKKMISHTDKYSIVVPVSENNNFEPLFAFYNKNLIPKIEDLLKQNQRKVRFIFPECQTKYIPMEDNDWYHNLNTIENYHDYLKIKKKSINQNQE